MRDFVLFFGLFSSANPALFCRSAIGPTATSFHTIRPSTTDPTREGEGANTTRCGIFQLKTFRKVDHLYIPLQIAGSNTSSSEVSFDSGGSHSSRGNGSGSGGQRPNVVINPLEQQQQQQQQQQHPTPTRRFTAGQNASSRTMNVSSRSPSRSQQVASPSVYYYSDTLRPRQNRGFVDSDGNLGQAAAAAGGGGEDGQGQDGSFPELRPQLPSARLAALATMSPTPSAASEGR